MEKLSALFGKGSDGLPSCGRGILVIKFDLLDTCPAYKAAGHGLGKMSRVGKKPISIPKEAEVKIENSVISVKGPKGNLSHEIPEGVKLEVSGDNILVTRSSDERRERSLHGLTRTLIANMIEGVTQGFKKELEVVGIGYRAAKSGKTLNLSLGFSHPIIFEEPEGVQIQVDKQIIRIEGIDKCLVGRTASKIRSYKKPDVYKGKGIRYVGEVVKKKVGKTGAK